MPAQAPAPNSPMIRQQLYDLINLAQSKASILHGPFQLLDTTGVGQFFDWKPPYVPNNLGAWNQNTVYQPGDMVTAQAASGQYLVINVVKNNSNTPPFDPNTGKPSIAWWQPWPSCYQRLRDEVNAAANLAPALATFQQSVSGPWPITIPNIQYDKLAFYYPDTGKQENVTIAGNAPVLECFAVDVGYADFTSWFFWNNPNSTGFPLWHTLFVNSQLISDTTNGGTQPGESITDITAIIPAPDPNNGAGTWQSRSIKSVTFEVDVGGTVPIPLNATFTANASAFAGITMQEVGNGTPNGGVSFPPNVYDGSDPTGFVNVDGSQWIPGAQLTTTFTGWGNFHVNGSPLGGGSDLPVAGGIVFTWKVKGMVPPGKYRVTLSTQSSMNLQANGLLVDDFVIAPDLTETETFTGTLNWSSQTFVTLSPFMTGSATIDFVSNQSVEVPGIHDTKKCLKIAVSNFSGQGFPPGAQMTFGYYHFDQFGNDQTKPPFGNSRGALPANSAGPFDMPKNLWNNLPPKDPGLLFIEYLDFFAWTITPSTLGYWFAKTPPIQNLGILPYERMPWNQFVTDPTDQNALLNAFLGYTPPYTGGPNTGQPPALAYNLFDAPTWIPATSNDEMLPWPKKWKPGVMYPANFTIIDSNGNLQRASGGRSGNGQPVWQWKDGAATQDGGLIWTCFKVLRKKTPTEQRDQAYKIGQTVIDSNGNQQTVTIAGNTGNTEPPWATTLNALTIDSGVTWKCSKMYPKLTPPVARITPPIYPAYKSTQQPPILKLGSSDINGHPIWDFGFTVGTTTNPPTAAGPDWWIYRVALNRIPQTKTTQKPPTAPIPVTIGCIRNGAFVAFGTYNTGQIIDAMWPVFIPEGLVYQATEVVDLQAEFITCGENYGIWGNATYPLAAAHINDLTAVLSLLS